MIEPPKTDIEKLRAKCIGEWAADEPIKWYNDAEGYSHEEPQGYYQIVDEDAGKEILTCGLEHGPICDDICEMHNALPAVLDELEALQAIVKELPASKMTYCHWCHSIEWRDGSLVHKADCLIARAKGLVKT